METHLKEQNSTRWNRVYINIPLYLQILKAKDNQERPIYKVAKFISRTAYPNGKIVHYLE